MQTSLMISTQQCDEASSLWILPAQRAFTLRMGAGGRELKVRQGQVWLTVTGPAPADDVWLAAGESLRLAAGCHVVVEGWSEARFELLVPPLPPAATARPALRRHRQVWASFMASLHHRPVWTV